MPFVAILIQQMPAIVAGITALFRSRHPSAPLPSDAQIIEALQAVMSGRHDASPLVALAAEQLPAIQAAVLKLWSEKRQPAEVQEGPTQEEMLDAWEEAFRAACRADITKDDELLAEVARRRRANQGKNV